MPTEFIRNHQELSIHFWKLLGLQSPLECVCVCCCFSVWGIFPCTPNSRICRWFKCQPWKYICTFLMLNTWMVPFNVITCVLNVSICLKDQSLGNKWNECHGLNFVPSGLLSSSPNCHAIWINSVSVASGKGYDWNNGSAMLTAVVDWQSYVVKLAQCL